MYFLAALALAGFELRADFSNDFVSPELLPLLGLESRAFVESELGLLLLSLPL